MRDIMSRSRAISFPFGKGFVIYTCFHNEKQASTIEQKLLQYLVVKPLMHGKAMQAEAILKEKGYKQTRAIVGMLDPGQESTVYEVDVPLNLQDIKIIVNWTGNAMK